MHCTLYDRVWSLCIHDIQQKFWGLRFWESGAMKSFMFERHKLAGFELRL